MNTTIEIATTTTTPVSMAISNEDFIKLFKKNIIPLYVVLPCLVWVLHDYFVTLEDEINYVWNKKKNLGRWLYVWIRYYTILLLIFDVVQIHSFAIPGVAIKSVCLAIDPTIRVIGAVSLWSIQIVMQLRVYALFDRSRKVAIVNACFFFLSILGFLIILVINAILRPALIAKAIGLPLPGCPVVNGLYQWAQWIPATVFELIMFSQVVYRSIASFSARIKLKQRVSLEEILVGDHILYFFSIFILLVFNNMMVITGVTKIPWFGLAPFHASMGIITCRMLLHLFKFTCDNLEGGLKSCGDLRSNVWRDLEVTDDSQSDGDMEVGANGNPVDVMGVWKGLDMDDMWRNVEGGSGAHAGQMMEVGGGASYVGKGKGRMRDYDDAEFGAAGEFDTYGGFDSKCMIVNPALTASHSRSGSISSSVHTRVETWEGDERRGSEGALLVGVTERASGSSKDFEGKT